MINQVIDANVNRVSEGLRVIEEYTRFQLSDETLTQQLSKLRKHIQREFPGYSEQLKSRSVATDVRAKEPPAKRNSVHDVLVANFKRVTEALRVLEEYGGSIRCNEMRYDVYDLEVLVMATVRQFQELKGIYVISDDPDILTKAVDQHVGMIQLRDKQASKDIVFNKSHDISAYAKLKGVPFIVNDFLDIALLVDADGVHTGQDDICPLQQRKVLG